LQDCDESSPRYCVLHRWSGERAEQDGGAGLERRQTEPGQAEAVARAVHHQTALQNPASAVYRSARERIVFPHR